MAHDVWTTVLDIISRLVVGYCLAHLAVRLHRAEKRQHKHEDYCRDKTDCPVRTRSAAAGKANGVGQDVTTSHDSGSKSSGGVRD